LCAGRPPYTVQSAMELLGEKIAEMRISDLVGTCRLFSNSGPSSRPGWKGFRRIFWSMRKIRLLRDHWLKFR
jgi:hypothetical protein